MSFPKSRAHGSARPRRFCLIWVPRRIHAARSHICRFPGGLAPSRPIPTLPCFRRETSFAQAFQTRRTQILLSSPCGLPLLPCPSIRIYILRLLPRWTSRKQASPLRPKSIRASLRENSSPLTGCRCHMYIYRLCPPSASQLCFPACRRRNIRSFQALRHILRLSACPICRIIKYYNLCHLILQLSYECIPPALYSCYTPCYHTHKEVIIFLDCRIQSNIIFSRHRQLKM